MEDAVIFWKQEFTKVMDGDKVAMLNFNSFFVFIDL